MSTVLIKSDYVIGDKINASDLNDLLKLLNPTGTILLWSTDTAPTAYILCDGAAISRTTFADLFAVIGTTYGVGDGSTTFNLPDMRGRLPLGQDDMGGTPADRVTDAQADALAGSLGAEKHTLTVGQMPGHSHDPPSLFNNVACTDAGSGFGWGQGAAGSNGPPTSDKGGGLSHNNLQPSLTLNYIIKD